MSSQAKDYSISTGNLPSINEVVAVNGGLDTFYQGYKSIRGSSWANSMNPVWFVNTVVKMF